MSAHNLVGEKTTVFSNLGPDACIDGTLFSQPEGFMPILGFVNDVMHGDSELAPSTRELLSAFVSGLNDCAFCRGVATQIRCGDSQHLCDHRTRHFRAVTKFTAPYLWGGGNWCSSVFGLPLRLRREGNDVFAELIPMLPVTLKYDDFNIQIAGVVHSPQRQG